MDPRLERQGKALPTPLCNSGKRMSKDYTTASRRKRGTITRSVLVRLDRDEAAKLETQQKVHNQTGPELIRLGWRASMERGSVAPPRPVRVVRDHIDAQQMAQMRQTAGLLAHGIANGFVPPGTTASLVQQIKAVLEIYKKRINAC